MSEYRDELAAAHARIQQLEEELGRRPKPFKPSPAPWLVAVLVADAQVQVWGAETGR